MVFGERQAEKVGVGTEGQERKDRGSRGIAEKFCDWVPAEVEGVG